MRKTTIALWGFNNLFLTTVLILTSSTTLATVYTGHIGGLVGVKLMDSDDWPELDTHFAMGILFDIKRDSWPISVALDIFDTGDKYEYNGMKDQSHTTEYHLGVRKIYMIQHSKIQPYLEGGVSIIYAELVVRLRVNQSTPKKGKPHRMAWPRMAKGPGDDPDAPTVKIRVTLEVISGTTLDAKIISKSKLGDWDYEFCSRCGHNVLESNGRIHSALHTIFAYELVRKGALPRAIAFH